MLGTTSDAVKHTWDSGVDSKTFTVFGTTSHAVKHTWDSGAVSKTFTVFGTTSGVLIPKLNLCSVKRLEDQQVFGSKQIKGSKQVLTDTIQIDSLDKYNRVEKHI